MTAATGMATADPVATEIIRSAFIACAQDMNATLIRSAYTPVIYEGRDCSVALLDANGDVLGQSLGLPLFLGNLEVCAKIVAEQIGWDGFKPGDIFLLNDSYLTGTHLNDATVIAPIFWRDRLAGFAATRAHWLDVGSKDPGGSMDSTEIYQEGLRIPPIRIYEDGRPRQDVIDLLERNSRYGDALIGDLNAQVAACRTGDVRFREILDRFGWEAYNAARDDIFRQSERLERQAISNIRDGVYESEGCLDNDGVGNGPLLAKVRIEIAGDRMTVDLTGSADQALGPVNSGFAQTVSACRVAFKLLINPDRPVDGGTFKTLQITAPDGSIFSAQEPAACQWFFSMLGLLIDLVVKALAPVMPGDVAAAHYGDSMALYLSGKDPRRDGAEYLYVAPHAGGWGASHETDGEDGLINNVNGAFRDYPVEVAEAKYPLIIREYGFRPDSGGAGRHRGGCGIHRTFEMCGPGYLNLWFERSLTPAWGLFGGGTGAGPDVVVNPGTDREQHLLKVSRLPLASGDVFRLETGGGGGYGEPLERDPALVREDVLDGYVTVDAALAEYGVVLAGGLDVDEQATEQARAARKAGA